MRSMCRVLIKKTRLQCTTKTVNMHVRLTQIVLEQVPCRSSDKWMLCCCIALFYVNSTWSLRLACWQLDTSCNMFRRQRILLLKMLNFASFLRTKNRQKVQISWIVAAYFVTLTSCMLIHIDGLQHKDTMSIFWRYRDFDAGWWLEQFLISGQPWNFNLL